MGLSSNFASEIGQISDIPRILWSIYNNTKGLFTLNVEVPLPLKVSTCLKKV